MESPKIKVENKEGVLQQERKKESGCGKKSQRAPKPGLRESQVHTPRRQTGLPRTGASAAWTLSVVMEKIFLLIWRVNV